MNEEYTVIDDYLNLELYQQVCSGIKKLYNIFNDPNDKTNGDDFSLLSTRHKLKNNEIKTIPLFVKKYLNRVLREDTYIFAQKILYIREMQSGIPWHIDTHISERFDDIKKSPHIDMIFKTFPVSTCVNIYYPFVPPTMLDGQLHVKTQSGEEVAIDIKPNRMVEIKGTTLHKTSSITPGSGEYRLSMVTEQLAIPTSIGKIVSKTDLPYDGIYDQILVTDEPGEFSYL